MGMLVKIGNEIYVERDEIAVFCGISHLKEDVLAKATDLSIGDKKRSAVLLKNGRWLTLDLSLDTLRSRMQ